MNEKRVITRQRVKRIKEKKKKFFGEFKEFALRGNVVDMAFGVVIGVAFTAITNSLVADIIMPIISLLTGSFDFSSWAIQISEGVYITYGTFIKTVINFVIIAFALFVVIRLVNKMRYEKKKEEMPKKPTEVEILTEIRDLLKEK